MGKLSQEELPGRPQLCNHTAHLYVDSQSLYDAVDVFVSGALDRGDAAIVVATQAHAQEIWARLERSGRDGTALRVSGQLRWIDAEDCLATIIKNREPIREAFDSLARGVIEQSLCRFPGLAIYGELVNLLWQQSNREAAHQLEQWWNQLIAEYGFTLMCGYCVNTFDETAQSGLDQICQTHSHLIPVADDIRLEQALDAALQQIIPNADVNSLRQDLVIRCRRQTQMPAAQAALLALQDIFPALAQDVRIVAREHYNRGCDKQAK